MFQPPIFREHRVEGRAEGTEEQPLHPRVDRGEDRGEDGESMAWCCTEGDNAQVGELVGRRLLADELQALVGPEVAVAIRDRVR